MKLNIEPKPIAVATIDLVKFRKILSKCWELKQAVYGATKIKQVTEIAEDDVLKVTHLAIDWGAIIGFMAHNTNTTMIVNIYMCRYKDRAKYMPGVLRDDGTLEFKETKESGVDLFVQNDFIKHPDHSIKRFIDNATYTYAKEDWKIEIVLEDKKK